MTLILRKARRGSFDDFDVMSGGFTAGRIYEAGNVQDDGDPWLWALNGLTENAPGTVLNGNARSVEEAMREGDCYNCGKWLAWAALQEAET